MLNSTGAIKMTKDRDNFAQKQATVVTCKI